MALGCDEQVYLLNPWSFVGNWAEQVLADARYAWILLRGGPHRDEVILFFLVSKLDVKVCEFFYCADDASFVIVLFQLLVRTAQTLSQSVGCGPSLVARFSRVRATRQRRLRTAGRTTLEALPPHLFLGHLGCRAGISVIGPVLFEPLVSIVRLR